MDLTDLIAALSRPAAYPYPVEHVEVHQTHISAVFLAGPYVYKLKKPVHLDFLDFSTLEKRLHFCHEEVRLNRRLAADVYLGVVPLARTAAGPRVEGEGEVLEWAVKMRRLPAEATLSERLRRGEVGVELLESLARRIAGFHRSAETNERIAAFGRFDGVARIVRDVLPHSAPDVGNTISRPVLDRLRERTESLLSQLRPLIERRAERGLPRDTHGDLRLDHIYWFPDRPPPADLVIIDCIEFNERFRFIDPVADMAFVVMDLVFHGRRDLANVFADAYFLAAEDAEGRTLLPLYTAYRAMVRGTVEELLLAESEVPPAERETACRQAKAHWLVALGELEEPQHRPCLLLVAGLPGSGKTTLARGLAERAKCCLVRSDVVRKEMAGLSAEEPTPPQLRETLYSREWNQRTYAECLRQAERLFFEGKRVLVDATFREEQQRQTFLQAAIGWGVPAILLLCRAEPQTMRARLAGRRGDASDADWTIHEQLAENWEEIGAETRAFCHVVSTEGSPEDGLARALAILQKTIGA